MAFRSLPTAPRHVTPQRAEIAKASDIASLVALLVDALLIPLARFAWAHIVHLIEGGGAPEVIADAVVRMVPLDHVAERITAEIVPITSSAARDAAVQTAHDFKITVVSGLDEAQRFAAERAAKLVVEIDDATRQAIHDAVIDGLRNGRSARDVATDVESVIGLHARWARAVRNRRAMLEATGLNRTMIDRQVEDYRRRLVRLRAEAIARTELLRATNEGNLAVWHDAEERGVFGEGGPVRTWVTAHDERLCPLCAPLDGVKVHGLDTPFVSGGLTVLTPPLHPNCRCRLTIAAAAPAAFERAPLRVA